MSNDINMPYSYTKGTTRYHRNGLNLLGYWYRFSPLNNKLRYNFDLTTYD